MTDPELKRILWRCRRGTRELDLVLSTFVSENYLDLSEALRRQFFDLLEVQDPVLTEWLCYDAKVDKEYQPIVALILQHKHNASFH